MIVSKVTYYLQGDNAESAYLNNLNSLQGKFNNSTGISLIGYNHACSPQGIVITLFKPWKEGDDGLKQIDEYQNLVANIWTLARIYNLTVSVHSETKTIGEKTMSTRGQQIREMISKLNATFGEGTESLAAVDSDVKESAIDSLESLTAMLEEATGRRVGDDHSEFSEDDEVSNDDVDDALRELFADVESLSDDFNYAEYVSGDQEGLIEHIRQVQDAVVDLRTDLDASLVVD